MITYSTWSPSDNEVKFAIVILHIMVIVVIYAVTRKGKDE